MVLSNWWSHPLIQEAGFQGGLVAMTLLLMTMERGYEGGVIPDAHATDKLLARRMMMGEAMGAADARSLVCIGIHDALDAGAIERVVDGEGAATGYRISDELIVQPDAARRTFSAERKAKYRAKNKPQDVRDKSGTSPGQEGDRPGQEGDNVPYVEGERELDLDQEGDPDRTGPRAHVDVQAPARGTHDHGDQDGPAGLLLRALESKVPDRSLHPKQTREVLALVEGNTSLAVEVTTAVNAEDSITSPAGYVKSFIARGGVAKRQRIKADDHPDQDSLDAQMEAFRAERRAMGHTV
jgi:hypothetical protein